MIICWHIGTFWQCQHEKIVRYVYVQGRVLKTGFGWDYGTHLSTAKVVLFFIRFSNGLSPGCPKLFRKTNQTTWRISTKNSGETLIKLERLSLGKTFLKLPYLTSDHSCPERNSLRIGVSYMRQVNVNIGPSNGLRSALRQNIYIYWTTSNKLQWNSNLNGSSFFNKI